jgi:hypothetical protein
MDDDFAYFMDPAVPNIFGVKAYAYMPLVELESRWHDFEQIGDHEWKYQRLAVFISKPEGNDLVDTCARRIRMNRASLVRLR